MREPVARGVERRGWDLLGDDHCCVTADGGREAIAHTGAHTLTRSDAPGHDH